MKKLTYELGERIGALRQIMACTPNFALQILCRDIIEAEIARHHGKKVDPNFWQTADTLFSRFTDNNKFPCGVPDDYIYPGKF